MPTLNPTWSPWKRQIPFPQSFLQQEEEPQKSDGKVFKLIWKVLNFWLHHPYRRIYLSHPHPQYKLMGYACTGLYDIYFIAFAQDKIQHQKMMFYPLNKKWITPTCWQIYFYARHFVPRKAFIKNMTWNPNQSKSEKVKIKTVITLIIRERHTYANNDCSINATDVIKPALIKHFPQI